MLIELIRAATVTDIVVSERMKVYEASFRYEIKNAPEYSYFLNIINFISQRDKIGITLQDETERVYDFSTGGERDYKEFIKNTLEDEIIDAKIRIDKKVINNHFSIYAFDEFTKDVLSLPVEEVMVAFSNLLKQSSNYLVFDVYSPITTFATKTMFFVPDGNGTVNSEFNRVKRMEECREGGCKIFCVYGNETFQIRIRYVVVFVGFCSRIFCRIYLSGYSISCPLSFIHAF